jgi:hypothetical protein
MFHAHPTSTARDSTDPLRSDHPLALPPTSACQEPDTRRRHAPLGAGSPPNLSISAWFGNGANSSIPLSFAVTVRSDNPRHIGGITVRRQVLLRRNPPLRAKNLTPGDDMHLLVLDLLPICPFLLGSRDLASQQDLLPVPSHPLHPTRRGQWGQQLHPAQFRRHCPQR